MHMCIVSAGRNIAATGQVGSEMGRRLCHLARPKAAKLKLTSNLSSSLRNGLTETEPWEKLAGAVTLTGQSVVDVSVGTGLVTPGSFVLNLNLAK
jgi:hypothetical protein